ncbi:hypothetical protein F5Y10DRAFT_267295 [Nemania abortiva]|nr:hypothetical protein F5Y10DRAFT_267295 [Nemania abortiva]
MKVFGVLALCITFNGVFAVPAIHATELGIQSRDRFKDNYPFENNFASNCNSTKITMNGPFPLLQADCEVIGDWRHTSIVELNNCLAFRGDDIVGLPYGNISNSCFNVAIIDKNSTIVADCTVKNRTVTAKFDLNYVVGNVFGNLSCFGIQSY